MANSIDDMARAKYLVTWQDVATGESGAFYTSWFDSEKYNPDLQMVIIDRVRDLVSFDGETWQDIEDDTL